MKYKQNFNTITHDQNNFPIGWTTARIGDICIKLVGGGTPSRERPEYFGGDMIWLTPTEIPKSKIVKIKDSKEKITNLGLKASSATLIPENAVLLTSRATIGSVAIAGCEVTTNQGFASFLCDEPIYNGYLAYWLWGNKDLLEANAKGTTFKEISKSILKELSIPLPPLNEQKRIVSKLEELFTKLDAGIEYLKKTQTLLKQYRQAVLTNAFEGKLTEKWRTENNTTFSLDKKNSKLINTEELISIPGSWDWIALNDISFKITDGEHFRPKTVSNGIPFLSAKDVTDKGVIFDNVLYVTSENAEKIRKRCNPEKDDILIVSRGATIGRTCLINTSKIFCLLGSVILIKPLNNVNKKFITYMIKSSHSQKKLTAISGSTAQQAIYLRDIKNIRIPLPPIQEQTIIASRLDYIFSIYENILNNIEVILKRTKNLRNRILSNAFEGKLVPQDPNDEPAEILLQKIKNGKHSEGNIMSSKVRRNTTNNYKQMRSM